MPCVIAFERGLLSPLLTAYADISLPLIHYLASPLLPAFAASFRRAMPFRLPFHYIFDYAIIFSHFHCFRRHFADIFALPILPLMPPPFYLRCQIFSAATLLYFGCHFLRFSPLPAADAAAFR